MGYANRVITLRFPHLTDDPEHDPIWVTIRNPRLIPPHELVPKDGGGIGPDGQPLDPERAQDSTYEIMSRIIVGWRAYDASQPVELDANGNDVSKPILLPQGKHTVENCKKLPLEIINEIGRQMREATNPS